MAQTTIDRLIINSPDEEPARHWRYEREMRTFDLVEDRRPAGYVVATPRSRSFDDPGVFVEIPLVNQIPPRVKAWRAAGYAGVTSITKRLLDHGRDPEEFDSRRFLFCQSEAVETLVWLTEAPAAERVGIEIPGDGGDFVRQELVLERVRDEEQALCEPGRPRVGHPRRRVMARARDRREDSGIRPR